MPARTLYCVTGTGAGTGAVPSLTLEEMVDLANPDANVGADVRHFDFAGEFRARDARGLRERAKDGKFSHCGVFRVVFGKGVVHSAVFEILLFHDASVCAWFGVKEKFVECFVIERASDASGDLELGANV